MSIFWFVIFLLDSMFHARSGHIELCFIGNFQGNGFWFESFSVRDELRGLGLEIFELSLFGWFSDLSQLSSGGRLSDDEFGGITLAFFVDLLALHEQS
jgi:hypothetical protein